MKTLIAVLLVTLAVNTNADIDAGAAISADISSAVARNATVAPAPLLERERFLDVLHVRDAVLSPDERRLAYLLREERASTLWLLDIASGKSRRLSYVDGVENILWSTNGKALFLETTNGIASVPTEEGRPAMIARTDEEKEKFFLGVDPALPAHVLLSEKTQDGHHQLLRVATNGNREVLREDAMRIRDVVSDANGKPAFVRQAQGDEQVVFRLTTDAKQEVLRCHYLDACDLLHFDAARNALLMITSHGDDYRRLAELDLATGKLRELHRDPENIASIDDVQLSETGTPLIARYRPGLVKNHGLTDRARQRLSIIEKQFPDSDVHVNAYTANGAWLVTVRRSTLRYEYRYLLNADNEIQPVLNELAVASAELDEQHMARKLPFTYTASDGMRLHAYLSLPLGVDARTAPLVAVVHGGPWNRADSGFSYSVQFLVNRGYIVFEPNFRASTGYSMSYVTSANGDFGKGRVQQDIVDGVEWLLARGIGDRERLAIAGHSFGGFSALAGLAFTPELFRAGFAGAPPSDFARSARMLIAQENDLENGVPMQALLTELLVDLDDANAVAQLTADSPRANAMNIVRPLAIWAGAEDDRVDVREVKHLALGLWQRGVDVTLLVDANAGHGPREDIEREAYLYLVEDLFARELGGRRQESISEPLARHLQQMMVFDGRESRSTNVDQEKRPARSSTR